MDVAAAVTVVVWIAAMILTCGIFAYLRRNSFRRFGRRTSWNEEPGSTEQGAHSSPYGRVPPYVFLHGSPSRQLETVVPELVYGDKSSFLQQYPILKRLLGKESVKGVKDVTLDIQDRMSSVEHQDSSWEVKNPCSSSRKSILADELKLEGSFREEESAIKEFASFRKVRDVHSQNEDEEAILLFDKVMKNQTLCVFCLEDFDWGCSVRILKCMHLFHTTCLRQWLRKSNKCPLCKTPVFVENENIRMMGSLTMSNAFQERATSLETFQQLTMHTIQWMDIERNEYRAGAQAWEHRNIFTAFI
eukprot:jgi/Galph1/4423/GphlegSOOS_G3116.1